MYHDYLRNKNATCVERLAHHPVDWIWWRIDCKESEQ